MPFRPGGKRLVNLMLCATALVVLGACSDSPTAAPAPTTAPPVLAVPEATATAVEQTAPPQVARLVVCSLEPSTLSPFAATQTVADLVALYFEPPVERVGYQWEPRLVTRIPSLENGDAVTRTIPAPFEGRYVDTAGLVVSSVYTGPLALSQLVVTFTLKTGLQWSDGEPLLAEDALLGFRLAQEASQGYWATLAERTEAFEAVDAHTLRWTGLPGFRTADFPAFLFLPQPVHRYEGQSFEQILSDAHPLATGPFMIASWEPGAALRLAPNPYFAGSAPKLEEIVVTFPPYDLSQWPYLLTTGECDVVLPEPAMQVDWRSWVALLAEQQALIWADTGPEPTFQRLDFNLDPAGDDSAVLANSSVRLALAHCIDRSRLVAAQPGQALLVADTFLPRDHPAVAESVLSTAVFSPEAGQKLLDAAGWRDEDGDGIREAHAVPDIADGTPLSFTLYLAPQYTIPAAHVAASLEACGVGVLPRPTDARILYQGGSSSPLFGHEFDIALYGWSAEAPHVCGAWLSERIPTAANDWTGENFSGYRSSAYDMACHRALAAVDAGEQYLALQEAASLLAQDMPTVFLTWRPFWFVARPEVVGMRPDASNAAAIWNIESVSLRD
ncbi:MAG: hypothetical protein JXB35_07515 [Anaerolineae bacterium]|nr:hypothetical protein [Anaerolineae bacterium]